MSPIARDRLQHYPGGSIRSNAWREIRARILARAEHRCEGTPDRPDCRVPDGSRNPATNAKVVLTIAHMDRGVTDHSDANLRALCQLCHNRWDGASRARASHATRRRHQGEGTGDLFCEDLP